MKFVISKLIVKLKFAVPIFSGGTFTALAWIPQRSQAAYRLCHILRRIIRLWANVLHQQMKQCWTVTECFIWNNPPSIQWPFRKTGTMRTLASQAEVGVWVQAPRLFCGSQPRKNFEMVHAQSCNLVHFGRKMVRNAVHNALLKQFNNENAVPVRSGSFSTMGTSLPRVPPWNDPCSANRKHRQQGRLV